MERKEFLMDNITELSEMQIPAHLTTHSAKS